MVSIHKLIHPTELFTGVGYRCLYTGLDNCSKVTSENDENDSITSLTSFCGVDARYCCSMVAIWCPSKCIFMQKYASMQGGKTKWAKVCNTSSSFQVSCSLPVLANHRTLSDSWKNRTCIAGDYDNGIFFFIFAVFLHCFLFNRRVGECLPETNFCLVFYFNVIFSSPDLSHQIIEDFVNILSGLGRGFYVRHLQIDVIKNEAAGSERVGVNYQENALFHFVELVENRCVRLADKENTIHIWKKCKWQIEKCADLPLKDRRNMNCR